MFTPQFGLFEQVKQSQLEMERSAQLDLEIGLAEADAPGWPTRLGGWLTHWGSQLQHRLAGLSTLAEPHHKTA